MPNIAAPKRTGTSDIPPEILSEIFIHCLPEDFTSQSQNAQQLLSSVCRLWRKLVLATPVLWASLDIVCDVNFLRPPLPVISTYLQRSGSHPFSFRLGELTPTLSSHNPNTLPAITTLATARQRWHKVDIAFVRITEHIFDLITLGDAPLLQSIRCYIVFSSEHSIPIHMLDCSPRLESFQWGSPTSSHLLMPLSNTQLTSLLLRASLSVSECVTLLDLFPRLSSAMFYGLVASDLSPIPRLTHLSMRTLTVKGAYSDTLLAALTLPALLDLDLEIIHAEWDIKLFDFFARSNPTLHQLSLSLSMTRTQDPEPAILRILTLVPHLRSLILIGRWDPPHFTPALIRSLHPSPLLGASLCPRLQRLYLSRVSDCPDGLCSAMLRARWGAQAHVNGVACLEWVNIEAMAGVHEHDRAGMEELFAEGMQAQLYFGNRYSRHQSIQMV